MKTLFTLFCIAISSCLLSQIPNSNFENWTYPTIPDDWLVSTAAYGTINKSSPGYNGSPYAVSLNLGPVPFGSGSKAEITTGNVISGTTYNYFVIDTIRPINLIGFYKGSSGLKVTVEIMKQGGGLIGKSNSLGGTYGSSASWQQFTIPISYTTTALCKSARIKLSNAGSQNSSILVDSLRFSYNITNINEISENYSLSIFPNPTSSDITIKSSLKFTKIKILNTIGEMILSQENTSTVSVSTLSKGIYFIELYDETSTLLKIGKFIKE
jgi:hypothetical protein